MTNRLPVSSQQNLWGDTQKVNKQDLDLEQSHNNNNTSAIVQNFFGSGVILENPLPKIIFDTNELSSTQASILAAGNFDGTGIDPTNQPTDTVYGNQLTVELSDSDVFGRFSVKVLIIGLSFDGQLQLDRFEFHKNETQTTKKHYVKVLTLMFNDYLGNNNCSKTYGGRIIVRETLPFELSREAVSIAQDVQPDIFFRDFKIADKNSTLFNTIQTAIGPAYDVNKLNINTTGKQPYRSIGPNDTITIIGQKFKAQSNNIQKVTLLLGAQKNNSAPVDQYYKWNGDLVVSIYKLQSTVNCPTDIIPELSIDYEPEQRPLAEININQQELRNIGYTLTDAAQPVDFIFSTTSIAKPGAIKIGEYYAVTIKRSGSNNLGTIFAEIGRDILPNSRLTVFNSAWADVAEEDLWFKIWSDSGKYATGMAYDNGNGVTSPKTEIDPSTGSTIDNYNTIVDFYSTGQNVNNISLLESVIEQSVVIQDEKTGNPRYSRQQYVPSVRFISSSDLNTLKSTSEPLILGCMSDTNPKENITIDFVQNLPGLAKGNLFTIVNPDPNLLSLRLIGSKLLPDNTCESFEYRIFKTVLCTDGYGDVNGDGYITQEDVDKALNELLGESLYSPSTQQKIIDGYFSTLELLRADVNGDGYVSSEDIDLIQQYVDKKINSFPAGTEFSHIDIYVQPSVGRWDGYFDCDGYIRVYDGYNCNYIDPYTLSAAELEYYGNPLPSNIDGDNPVVWNAVTFNPVNCTIEFQPFWQDYLLALSSKAKELPTTFSFKESINKTKCSSDAMFGCSEKDEISSDCDSGRNDFFIPGNLILGEGSVLSRDGTPIKPDLETALINLELPIEPLSEVSIDVLRNFLADRGDGFTNASYPAAKYYDCTTVKAPDINLDRLRFNVSIQSYAKNIDGYDGYDGYGVVVDNIVGVFMDHSTGILKLTAADVENNPYFKTLVTRIQIVVYLKKSGWINKLINVPAKDLYDLAIISPLNQLFVT